MGRDEHPISRRNDSAGSSMKRSAGNAFGNVMGCFFAVIVIIVIFMVLGQLG